MGKITGYGAFATLALNDLLIGVDVDDTSMAATGTDKKLTLGQLLSMLGPTLVLPSGDTTGATDTPAIQAAMNAGGALLAPGTFNTNASLVFNSDGVTLRGFGNASIIKPVSGAQFDVISTPVPGSSGTAGFTRNYSRVESLAIDCSAMSGTTAGKGNAIHFYGSIYGVIRDVYITQCKNWNVLLDGDSTNFGFNNHLFRCIFDSGAAGVMATGCEANEIISCLFKQAGSATAANQPAFTPQSTAAYHLWMTSGYQTVIGNVFGNLGTYTTEAIRAENSGPVRIIGNRFDQVRNQAFHCTAGRAVIMGNQFGNSGSAVTGVPTVELGSGGNSVTGNVWDTTNGAAHWSYCVQEDGAYTGNLIEGNQFIAGTSGVLNLNAGSTPHVHQNPGFNPAAITAPGVPATTVAYTNQFGVDAAVYITAGASTCAVAIGGVAMFTIASAGTGTVRVPAGQTVTLTYTSAPTWKWAGD